MKRINNFGEWDQIAKDNGYNGKDELFLDYQVVPSVRMAKHRKIELIPLLLKYLKNKK